MQWTACGWQQRLWQPKAVEQCVWCRSRNDFQWSESKIDVLLTLRNVAPMLERNEANPPLNRQQPKRQSNAKQSNAKQRKAAQRFLLSSAVAKRFDGLCTVCSPFSVSATADAVRLIR